MLKKLSPFIVALIAFLGFPLIASADGHFTASNVHYNQATSEITFDGTGFSPTATWYDSVGISSCNDSSICANNGGEFWGPSTYFSNYQQFSLSEPQHFDVTFAFNSYRPSSQTVYLWVKTDGDGRTYSQALDLNTISGYAPFTASNVHYNPSTNELSFTGTGISPSASTYDSIGISSCNDIYSCANNDDEFWGPDDYFTNHQNLTLNDPQNFDATLAFNSYRPSAGTVYVWVKTNSFGRNYSQALDYNSIVTPTLVSAINAGGGAQGSFVADTDYNSGSSYTSSSSVTTSGVTNPAPQAVYQSVRYGNFTYTIPNLTANSNYRVRLHFNELYWGTDGSDGNGKRVFNVSLNGTQVLHNFDIYKVAGGANKALVEQFNTTADSNGQIAIALSSVTDNAMVNGIEVYTPTISTHTLSGTVYNDTNRNGTQDSGEAGQSGVTVALSDGQTTTTDSNGHYSFSNLPEEDTYVATITPPNDYVTTTSNPARFALTADTTKNFGIAQFQSLSINAGGSSASSFVSDVDYSGGSPYSSTASVDTTGVTNPAPQSVYQTVRYGNSFSYTIPNLSSSNNYTVRLHFNELYFNTSGSRVFNVGINGSQVLSNYDIFQDAGGENKAVVKEFTATPDSNGNITINFTTVTDNAMVNGIEVIQQ